MPPTAYKWRCPLCGDSRMKLLDANRSRSAVENHLRAHVRSSGDDQHGPSGSYPDEVSPKGLERHVSSEHLLDG